MTILIKTLLVKGEDGIQEEATTRYTCESCRNRPADFHYGVASDLQITICKRCAVILSRSILVDLTLLFDGQEKEKDKEKEKE